MFEPLSGIAGVRLVSLQKGYGSEQIEQNKDKMNIIEWSDPTDVTAEALVDTAAVMKNRDRRAHEYFSKNATSGSFWLILAHVFGGGHEPQR
jgi:hypothetical protein